VPTECLMSDYITKGPDKHNDITSGKKYATENANTVSKDTYETV